MQRVATCDVQRSGVHDAMAAEREKNTERAKRTCELRVKQAMRSSARAASPPVHACGAPRARCVSSTCLQACLLNDSKARPPQHLQLADHACTGGLRRSSRSGLCGCSSSTARGVAPRVRFVGGRICIRAAMMLLLILALSLLCTTTLAFLLLFAFAIPVTTAAATATATAAPAAAAFALAAAGFFMLLAPFARVRVRVRRRVGGRGAGGPTG